MCFARRPGPSDCETNRPFDETTGTIRETIRPMSDTIGVKVETWDDLDKAPGNWMFSLRSDSDPVQGIGGILYNCPCGCGRIGGVDFNPRNPSHSEAVGRAVWNWDGNEHNPTLTPSIRHIPHPMGPHSTEAERQQAACAWHGHLVAGVFKGC
jgi:hypothetical protein